MSSKPVKTFVLVPGAWHGAWAWRPVERLLRALGHEVLAITLTGVAERAHLLSPAVRLETHVRDVAQAIEVEDLRGVTLVGHSYGGMVITPAAARVPGRIAELVYLDAFVPKPGESMLDLMKAKYSDSWRSRAKKESNGLSVPVMLDATAMGLSGSAAAAVDAKLTPHPMATLEDKAEFDEKAITAVPKRFIRCSAYAGFKPWAEKAAAWGWPVENLDAGHDGMLIAPRALADLLVR